MPDKKVREQDLGKLNYELFQHAEGIEHPPDFELLSKHEQNSWSIAALGVRKAGTVQTADDPNDPNDPDSGPG